MIDGYRSLMRNAVSKLRSASQACTSGVKALSNAALLRRGADEGEDARRHIVGGQRGPSRLVFD